jgi:ABC-type oligopeptide transport system ATPase subunit
VTSDEIFNTDIVNDMLSFPLHPYTTGLINQNQSYSDPKTVRMRRFQPKTGKKNSISEQGQGLVLELSYKNNLVSDEVWIMIFSDWAEFQSGNSFNSVLPFWIESVSDR